MRSTIRQTLSLLTRLAAACSIIAAIFVVLSSDVEELETQKADADIADFMSQAVFAPRSTTSIIAGAGLTPRVYEINGNTVHFAVGESSLPPQEVLEYFQTEFAASGINSRKWMANPQQKTMGDVEKYKKHKDEISEYFKAMMDGEVVPYSVSDSYVAMGGPVIRGDSFKEVYDRVGEEVFEHPNRLMKGWRFIDAERKDSGKTRITSLWADDDFDFEAFHQPEKGDLELNPDVPFCPGCKLTNRSRSLQSNEPLGIEQFVAQQDPSALVDFYTRAMIGRGWELSEQAKVMNYVASKVPDHPFNTHGRFLTFSKGTSGHVSYTILPTENGTVSVTATQEF